MIFHTQDRQWVVILSEAKDLTGRGPRSFAEFTLERSEGLKMTEPVVMVNIHCRGQLRV